MKTIEVLKDTKIIEENTKDALAVNIYDRQPTEKTEFNTDEGVLEIDGTATRTLKTLSTVNLSNLKVRIESINSEIARLEAEKAETLATIALIEPELDKAIADILKEEGAVDNRAK